MNEKKLLNSASIKFKKIILILITVPFLMELIVFLGIMLFILLKFKNTVMIRTIELFN